MTIKVVDKKNKRIQYGCDLAIVYYDFRGEMYYLHNYKDYRGYQFVHKSNARDIDSSVDTICDYYENGWNLIREEYLLLKNNNNDPNKKSFMLYIEAVNNVYHQMLCEQDDDDDDWWDDDDY